MRQKIYILGLLTVAVTMAGTIFKINHWPGAAIMLISGLLSMAFLFMPAALISHYRSCNGSGNRLLHIVTGITAMALFTGMLFKILHWPLAGYMLMFVLPLPYIVFLPVFLYNTSRDKNYNVYNLVFVLCLLAFHSVFIQLLSLNVTKERIDDSYNLVRNYIKVGEALRQLGDNRGVEPFGVNMDETCRIADEYKALILKEEGISMADWNHNPGNLLRPDRGAAGGFILEKAEGQPVGARLESAFIRLLGEMEGAGCPDLRNITLNILECKNPASQEPEWVYRNFIDSNLPWSLLYLDEVQTNLRYLYLSHQSCD
jgi:hypothetical protein